MFANDLSDRAAKTACAISGIHFIKYNIVQIEIVGKQHKH